MMFKRILFFKQPFRKMFLKISDYIPQRYEERLLDHLYPEDIQVDFKEDV